MRTIVTALATIAILTMPAYSHGKGKGGKRSQTGQQTEDQKKKASQAEKAYKDALGRIPDQKPSDPWENLRK